MAGHLAPGLSTSLGSPFILFNSLKSGICAATSGVCTVSGNGLLPVLQQATIWISTGLNRKSISRWSIYQCFLWDVIYIYIYIYSQISTGSGNGLVPSDNKPSSRPLLYQMFITIQLHSSVIIWGQLNDTDKSNVGHDRPMERDTENPPVSTWLWKKSISMPVLYCWSSGTRSIDKPGVCLHLIDSWIPGGAYMHHKVVSILVSTMACCLISIKPSSKPMLTGKELLK